MAKQEEQRGQSIKADFQIHILDRKMKPAVPAESRSTTPGGGNKALQRPHSQHMDKRKANELVNSGDPIKPAKRRPAPGAVSAPLPTIPTVTGSWQICPP